MMNPRAPAFTPKTAFPLPSERPKPSHAYPQESFGPSTAAVPGAPVVVHEPIAVIHDSFKECLRALYGEQLPAMPQLLNFDAMFLGATLHAHQTHQLSVTSSTAGVGTLLSQVDQFWSHYPLAMCNLARKVVLCAEGVEDEKDVDPETRKSPDWVLLPSEYKKYRSSVLCLPNSETLSPVAKWLVDTMSCTGPITEAETHLAIEYFIISFHYLLRLVFAEQEAFCLPNVTERLLALRDMLWHGCPTRFSTFVKCVIPLSLLATVYRSHLKQCVTSSTSIPSLNKILQVKLMLCLKFPQLVIGVLQLSQRSIALAREEALKLLAPTDFLATATFGDIIMILHQSASRVVPQPLLLKCCAAVCEDQRFALSPNEPPLESYFVFVPQQQRDQQVAPKNDAACASATQPEETEAKLISPVPQASSPTATQTITPARDSNRMLAESLVNMESSAFDFALYAIAASDMVSVAMCLTVMEAVEALCDGNRAPLAEVMSMPPPPALLELLQIVARGVQPGNLTQRKTVRNCTSIVRAREQRRAKRKKEKAAAGGGTGAGSPFLLPSAVVPSSSGGGGGPTKSPPLMFDAAMIWHTPTNEDDAEDDQW